MVSVSSVISKMIHYNSGDPRRINHALKVYAFAKAIGEQEGLPLVQQQTLETAAVLHDIGIHVSEEKYHSAAGNYQEIEGPPIAQVMLGALVFPGRSWNGVLFDLSSPYILRDRRLGLSDSDRGGFHRQHL